MNTAKCYGKGTEEVSCDSDGAAAAAVNLELDSAVFTEGEGDSLWGHRCQDVHGVRESQEGL